MNTLDVDKKEGERIKIRYLTKHLKIRVIGSRLQWAGHGERISEERWTDRALETERGSRRRRGRLTIRWGDSVKREWQKIWIGFVQQTVNTSYSYRPFGAKFWD